MATTYKDLIKVMEETGMWQKTILNEYESIVEAASGGITSAAIDTLIKTVQEIFDSCKGENVASPTDLSDRTKEKVNAIWLGVGMGVETGTEEKYGVTDNPYWKFEWGGGKGEPPADSGKIYLYDHAAVVIKTKKVEPNTVDESGEEVKLLYPASSVVFSDNKTFQEKYDSGELTGPAGKDGAKGDKGDKGDTASITGGASTIATANLTASRALVSNSSGKVAVSAVTATQLGYLSGVTSAIQTQLDAKATKTEMNNAIQSAIQATWEASY